MFISRCRKFPLSIVTLASLVLTLSACGINSSHSSSGIPSGAQLVGQEPALEVSKGGQLSVDLTAAESMVPYGNRTRWAMTYNGTVSGPTIVVHPGDKLTIRLQNNLSVPTSLHTHGLHVSPFQDDPFVMVEPGQERTYTYNIAADQLAGTFWYHPHVHGSTAEQVAAGLSGAILVQDMDDDQLASISTSRVLVINDPPIVDKNPSTTQSDSGMGNMLGMGGMDNNSSGTDMMTAMMGRTGPKLLTNGFEGLKLAGSGGKLERVHLVNATASSRLQFKFSGAKMLQISSDGGRLSKPVVVSDLVLASGQRAEVVLVADSQGGSLSAQRLSNEIGGELQGSPETIATITADAGKDASSMPSSFMMASTQDLFSADTQVAKQRIVTLSSHMNPRIDGKLFDPNVVNFVARMGTIEEWVFKNTSPMYHPIHLHTWNFQIKGELGWHDTVVVPPNSAVKVRINFADYAGTTVLHCHILDHEDTGMMAIIKVA